MSHSSRIGWLFAYDWDRQALDALAANRRLRFDHGGFDLFAFPSNAGLVGFDLDRFAARQAARGKRLGWQGVLSHHEQFGALGAALVAERMGLPGATPESILAAQHKLYARQVLQRVAPEANLASTELPCAYGEAIPPGLEYPSFVKPVKAAFSVLARRVDSQAELYEHTRFGRWELWVIRSLVEPFERVCRARLPQAGTAHRMMLESPIPAHVAQYNLDGWVQDGRVQMLGVVDAIMYPGTQAFMRWEHPSQSSAAVQQRALDVAQRFLTAIGYRHGFFNLEFFYDASLDRLTVIECNPRLASQFADLYRRVQGRDAHAMAVDLALGKLPQTQATQAPTAGAAASIVYRSFAGEPVPAEPSAKAAAQMAAKFPGSMLHRFPKQGSSLERDFKWTGSHRYGIIHLGARDREQLRLHTEQASALLGWPAPYLDVYAANRADISGVSPQPDQADTWQPAMAQSTGAWMP